MPATPYLMTPIEVAWGYIFGTVPAGAAPAVGAPSTSPRRALEEVVRPLLARTPCMVAFSGGRDSSLVLAVATHVARRDGLPEPVPLTRVFPSDAETHETDWQEQVIRHLGLAEWERLEIHDELEVISPLATDILDEFGAVVWPPTLVTYVPLFDVARGGSLLDGEGGDEVLGDAEHRIGRVARLVRRPRTLRRDRIRRALGALAPAPVRSALARRRIDAELPTPWLRQSARDGLIEAIADEERSRPLRFSASVRHFARRRPHVLGLRARDALAERWSVTCSSPLMEPAVVDALGRAGGVIGPGDRTAVLRSMASDLLPDSVLSRGTKADFTSSYMGPIARRFAEGWDGSGVDLELVDPEPLRRVWSVGPPHAMTGALLQSAWLAQHGVSRIRS